MRTGACAGATDKSNSLPLCDALADADINYAHMGVQGLVVAIVFNNDAAPVYSPFHPASVTVPSAAARTSYRRTR